MDYIFIPIGIVCGCLQYFILGRIVLAKMSRGGSTALMFLQLPVPLFLVAFALLYSMKAALFAVTSFFVALVLLALILRKKK